MQADLTRQLDAIRKAGGTPTAEQVKRMEESFQLLRTRKNFTVITKTNTETGTQLDIGVEDFAPLLGSASTDASEKDGFWDTTEWLWGGISQMWNDGYLPGNNDE